MDLVAIVFTSHLKLDSFKVISNLESLQNRFVLLSPHKVYPNEAMVISKYIPNSTFLCFSDLLSDKDMEQCDIWADTSDITSQMDYYDRIKKVKNTLLLNRLKDKIPYHRGYIFNDDLGIELDCWLANGFHKIDGSNYYDKPEIKKISLLDRIKNKTKYFIGNFNKDAYVAHWKGEKYVFYGSMNRISYRLNIDFKKSSKEKLLRGIEKLYIKYISKTGFNRNIIRLTTFHEYEPIASTLPLSIMQDGYLPPNYTSRYMKYFVEKTEFLAWDQIGMRTFINQSLPVKIIPFRKKLYLPNPIIPKKVRKVLCVSSGAGDWTALKNRSDEDKMVLAFAEIAQKYPEIEFVYRCHPVWIIPQHQGVNSIRRVIDYYDSLGLPNLHVSSNIPSAYQEGKMVLSYKRSSLEDDLKNVDLIFGEHSISMIDGAFKHILFASVNLTGRRDFFESITQLGFPHCESLEDISQIIETINTEDFKNNYLKAVSNYNTMTDMN